MINADSRDFRKLPNKRKIEVSKEIVIRHKHAKPFPSLAAAFTSASALFSDGCTFMPSEGSQLSVTSRAKDADAC